MLSIRKLKMVVPAALAVFAGVLLCASAPALAAAPETPALTVESHYPSPVHPSTEAVLHGVLNPGGSGPQFTFELGTYEFLYNEGSDCEGGGATARGISLGEGAEVLPTETIGGLSQGKEYTVCLRFVTAGGEAVKPEVHFTTSVTPEAPVTREAESITATSATLKGELNPLNAGTVGYEFMYNQGSSCENGTVTTPGSEQTGKAVEVSTSVAGLAANTQYTFCAVAVNASGEPVLGPPSTFKTQALAPEVVVASEQSSSVTPFEARLEATVDAENQPTTCEFEYGTSTAYTSKVSCEQATIEGSGPQGVGLTIAHLTPATTYHFRVVLENKAHEKAAGPDQQLTTLTEEKPTVEPGANPPAVTPFEATVEGQVNPEYQATTYSLEYSTTKPVGAKLEGPVVTVKGGGSLTGIGAQPVSISTVGVLTPATTYYYQVLATNETGTTEGAVESFMTLPAEKPAVEPESSSGLTPFEATLEAQVSPDYQETSYSFQYATAATGETLEGTIVPLKGGTLSGGGVQAASAATGKALTPGSTYYYRVIATNKTGTTEGKVEKLETPALIKPVIESENASIQSPFAATLEATVNPEYQETTCTFEYSTEASFPQGSKTTTKTCPTSLGNGGGGVGTSVPATGLQSNTKYYFRIIATNTTGTTESTSELTTQTAQAPSIESESVAFITSTGATLRAQLNPNYQETAYTFEYATKESVLRKGQGTKVPGGTLPAGNGGQAVHADLRGVLTAGTKYYYRVVATNTAGTTAGMVTVQSFTTPTPPTASTGAVEFVGSSTAGVSGTVNPEGLETYYEIEYGPTTSYGQSTASADAGAETMNVPTGSIKLDPLNPNTTYHYRLVAINTLGETTRGADMQFTTAAGPPPPPTPPSNGSGETPPQSTSSTSTAGVFPNLTAIAPVPATKEAGEAAPSEVKSLTRAQKLAKALKQCKREKKSVRLGCEKRAKGKYGPKTRKGKRGRKA